MNRTKFYKISSICLLIINLILIGFIIFAPPRHKKIGPKHFIIEKLNFDKQQINQFQVSIEKHRKSRKEIRNKITSEKNNLYQLLLNDNIALERDTILSILSNLHQETEIVDYEHFSELKLLCKGEQKKKFKELIHDLSELFKAKKRPKKK